MDSLADKTILILGGTGSFGGAVLDRLLETGCREIRIFSRDELKQERLRIKYANPRIKFYTGDVRDKDAVDHVMQGVDLVFHAAALKQVPSCEFFLLQAVRTNILGSYHVVTSAIEHRVECVVCLSTDKAAYPINAMGMTKALREKIGDLVSIVDSDFHGIAPERRRTGPAGVAPLKLGNNVWFGSRVIVQKGVTIGENPIVAANSVVTSSIPSTSIAAGLPARAVKRFGEDPSPEKTGAGPIGSAI